MTPPVMWIIPKLYETQKAAGMGTYWSNGPQPVLERPTHLLLGSSLQGHRMSSSGLCGSSLASGLALPLSHQRLSLSLGLSSPPCKVETMGQRERA